MPKLKNTDYKIYTRKELLVMRDEAICQEFLRLTKNRHLEANYVVHEKLQTKFFLDPDSIWLIVRGLYKRKYHKN